MNQIARLTSLNYKFQHLGLKLKTVDVASSAVWIKLRYEHNGGLGSSFFYSRSYVLLLSPCSRATQRLRCGTLITLMEVLLFIQEKHSPVYLLEYVAIGYEVRTSFCLS